jgi:hypothetical protein
MTPGVHRRCHHTTEAHHAVRRQRGRLRAAVGSLQRLGQQPESDDGKVVIEGVSKPNPHASHDREAGGIDGR